MRERVDTSNEYKKAEKQKFMLLLYYLDQRLQNISQEQTYIKYCKNVECNITNLSKSFSLYQTHKFFL